VVSEDPERFLLEALPSGTDLRHRDDLAAAQDSLCTQPGVSVLIFDQVCAAEKRRRRKIGAFPDPDRRIFINALVCEGCGDCSVQSNCLAIQPLETELGRKRKIDQSACNKDVSCAKGFCPSFVTVEGGRLHQATGEIAFQEPNLPLPVLPLLRDSFNMVIAGIGGTGVVTVSAILGMAARLEGLGANLFDMTGLSQKGGAVFSHIRLSRDPTATMAAKVGAGRADVVLACDLVAATQSECLDVIALGTVIGANTDMMATAAFQTNRDLRIESTALVEALAKASGRQPFVLAGTSQAEALLGDSIFTNLLMLGYVWQLGGIPLPLPAIERAIKLNGKSADQNLKAFAAGRRAAIAAPEPPAPPPTLQAFIDGRAKDLELYWNKAYAKRYIDVVSSVRDAAAALEGGDVLVWAVARSAYKLMAYKDEYEVARLYSDGRFRDALAAEFREIRTVKIHLAPPLFARTDPRTGRPRKLTFGAWMLPVLRALAQLKVLRETPLDIFGYSQERKQERALRNAYLALIARLVRTLSQETLNGVIASAEAPLAVRGFGPVREKAARALLGELYRQLAAR
jgi:indolepyruvate ferredoxin oxidoreductase